MSRRGWALFVALSLIWGVPYLLIKVAVGHVDPSVVVFVRVALAAAVLLPVALTRGQLASLRPVLVWVVAFAVVEICLPFLALSFAETRLPSSLTALFIATVPMVSAVIATVFRLDDRLTPIRIVGLVVGLVGVGCLVGLDVHGSEVIGVLALLITVTGYAIGPLIIAARLSTVPPVSVISVALGLAALVYLVPAVHEWPDQPVPANAWWAMVALGLICTALAFLVLFALVAEAGPTRTTVITFINPAVAVVLGVVVLSEPVTVGLLIGFPLVLLGSVLATRRH